MLLFTQRLWSRLKDAQADLRWFSEGKPKKPKKHNKISQDKSKTDVRLKGFQSTAGHALLQNLANLLREGLGMRLDTRGGSSTAGRVAH